jgi:uncharacterized membrane protein
MIKPENIQEATQDAIDKMNAAKSNIRKGLRLFAFSIARLFLEAWIVQSIWNHVVVTATEANAVTYWQSFFGMIMIRILAGQFKISLTTQKDKQK